MVNNNDFVVQLIAALQVAKSKKQVNSDIKQIEKSLNLVRLTATLLRGDSKKAIKEQINQIQTQLTPVKLAVKLEEKQAQRAVNNALKNVKFTDIDININQNSLNLKLRKALSSANSHIPKITIPVDYDIKKQRLQNELTSYLTKNSKIRESSGLLSEGDDLKALFDRINDKKSFTEATERFRLYKSEVQATGYAGASTTEKLKNMVSKISQIGSMFGVGAIMVRKFSDSLKTLKDNSTILTEIAKTSEMTARQIQAIGDSSFGVASKYGIRSSGYLEGVREMSRSGYNELSKELGELSVLAQSAGDMTADSANNYLLATDAAYKYKGSIEQLTAALDGANYISNKNSSTLTDIADGVRVSASYAAEAGVQIDELTAAEATMIATTKRSGSEMGRAFRSILLNLQQVKGEFDGEIIDEESLKKVEARCHSLGVELETMTSEGAKLRNPMEILKELAQVYNSLPDSSVDKQGIISDIGGKYHANALAALLSNWSSYEKMLEEFSQGTGSSLKEAAKTADSWEGRLNALQNQWDSFVNHVTDQSTIKNSLSFMDTAIGGAEKLVDTLGAIPTLLTAITGAYTLLNKDYGITQIMNPESGKFDIQGKYMGIDITALKAQKKHFTEAEDAIAQWNKQVSVGLNDINKFEISVVKNNTQLKEYLSTCTDGTASLAGYRASLKAAGVETEALRLKTVLMTSAVSFGLGLAIQAGISLITKFVDEHVHAQERALEAAQEASANIKAINDTYASHKKTVEDLADSYDKLSRGIDNNSNKNISLSTEDYNKFLDINKQLADAFPQLISTIDENGNAILALGSNGKSASDDLRELLKAEEDLQNFKISQNLGDLFSGVKVQVDEAIQRQEEFDAEIKHTEDSLNRLRDLAESKITIGDSVEFSGDLLNEGDSKYYEVMNSAIQKLYKSLDNNRRVQLADTLDLSKLIHINEGGTAFDLYLNTAELSSNEKQMLERIIQEQAKTVVGTISDSLNQSVQANNEKSNEAQLAWKDFIANMVSGMKSQQTFKDLDASMQEIAISMVSGLQMNVAEEIDKKDPYSYIRDSIITPLTYLSDDASKELSKAYSNLFSMDMDKLTPNIAAEEIDKYVNKIASILGKTPVEIKTALGFDSFDTLADDFDNAISAAADKFWPDFVRKAKYELESLEQAGSIDFLIRPQIDTSELEKAGWGEQESGIATVYSSTYTNEDGTKAVVVTPILPDGKVLSPEDLEAYANDLLAGESIDANIKMGLFEGKDAQKQADDFANTIHNLHDTLFVGKEDSLWEQLYKFFDENSINTPEEISTWNEIASKASSAAGAMAEYARQKSIAASQTESTSPFIDIPVEKLEEYISLLKSGTIDEKTISSYAELNAIMKQTGLSTEEAVKSFKEFSDDYTLSSQLVSDMESTTALIAKLKDEIMQTGSLGTDSLSALAKQFPELENSVSQFNQGLISTDELIVLLQTVYESDADAFRSAMSSKLSGNETFFETIKDNNQGLFENLAKAYDLDVNNWKTLAQAKAAIDQQLIQNLSSAWSKYYGTVIDTATGMTKLTGPAPRHGSSQGVAFSDPEQGKAYAAALDAVSKANALKNKLDEAAKIEVDVPDFEGIKPEGYKSGSKDEKEKEPKTKDFDWIKRREELLQSLHDKEMENANDESASYQTRIALIDDLIAKDNERLAFNQAAAASYSKVWKEAYDKILEEAAKQGQDGHGIISSIKEGNTVDQTITDSTADQKLIDAVQAGIDAYDDLMASQEKSEEINKEITDHLKEQRDLKLAIVQAQIDIVSAEADSLSAEIKLMEATGKAVGKEQLKKQISLSDELVDSYYDRISALEDEISALDNEDSAQYHSLMSEIYQCNAAIADCAVQQAEWNDQIKRLPIEKISRTLEMLGFVKEDLQNFIDQQNALGKATSLPQFQEMANINLKQLKELMKQQKLLSDLLEDYEYGSTKYQDTVSDLQDIDNEISGLIQNQYDWNKAILQLPIDQLSKAGDVLQNAVTAMSDILADYDSAISAVTGTLDKQIKAINDLKDATTDEYESKIKPLQDELDTLQKQNEARKIQLDLEKAQYDLDRANEQKTNKVVRDGEMVYEADQDAIRSAENTKNDAEYNKVVHDLEEQISNLEEERDKLLEGYDDQIEKLDEIKDRWSSIVEEIKLAADALKANDVLGAGWQDKILSGNDEEMLNSLKDLYTTISNQKNQYEEQIASNERIADMMNQFMESWQNGSITYDQAMAGIKDLANQMKDGYSSLEHLDAIMGLNGATDLESLLDKMQNSANASVDQFEDYMKIVKENADALDQYNSSWEEMQQNIRDQIAALEKLAEEAAKMANTINKHTSSGGGGGNKGPNVNDKTFVDSGPGVALAKALGDEKGIPEYHDGGIVGEQSSFEFQKRILEKLNLNIDKNEMLAKLQRGEFVITEEQMMNMTENGKRLARASFSPDTLAYIDGHKIYETKQDSTPNVTVTMGDVNLPNVKDPDGFVRFIGSNFESAMRQQYSSRDNYIR